MQFLSGISGLGAGPASAEELAGMINMSKATAYNSSHSGQGWSTVGDVNASTSDFATTVAMFQYAIGMRIDGMLTPNVAITLSQHQKTNIYGYADQRIYAIPLAVSVVVKKMPGSKVALWAALAALGVGGLFLLRNR